MKAVVLMGGEGTRLHTLTDNKLKGMVEGNGKPLITHCFDQLIDLGADELIVVGYMKEVIMVHYDDEYENVPITYTHQREQKELAHALLTKRRSTATALTACSSPTRPRGRTSSICTEPWDWQDYVVKGVFDVAFASIVILCLAPMMISIAAVINLDSSGPVLYSQTRTTALGETLEIYKFRSIVPTSKRQPA